MKHPTKQHPLPVTWTALGAALAALVNTSQAQVTFPQVTNGLVGWYPLDSVVTNGSTLTTPDHLSGRDLILTPAMTAAKVVPSTRPSLNPATVSNCFNLNQSGGATVVYYNSKGQDPLTGGGDFLPFCNQLNATMSFWIKGNAVGTDTRFFGEADTTGGQANPLYLWGDHSSAPGSAHLLFRQEQGGTGPAGSIRMVDGTYQLPVPGYYMAQDNTYTTQPVLDGNWHMFTVTVDTNASASVYVDGVLDAGTGTWTDAYGNPSTCRPHLITNLWYTTNLYPAAGVSNPPPNGYVRWMLNGVFKTGSTAFGGFKRGSVTPGVPCQIDDIAFWNRALNGDEIVFVYTNGLTGIPINRPLQINSWTADFAEIGQGDSVTLRWNVTGALTNANSGGIVISGVGDVSSKGLIGSTNVTLSGNQTYHFTLTIHNGLAPDTNATLSVATLAGVSPDWHLIERFDGVFTDTADGISGNNWISAGSDFTGSFDKWNVVTLTNSGARNKVLTPRTGYLANEGSASGYESRGALSYARLGSLTLAPGQSNTLFFRFSLRETPTYADGVYSDLDFGAGLTDYGFLGPSGGLGYYGGTGGGLGPYFSILRGTSLAGGPFDLFAPDTADPADTNTAGTFSYVASVEPNGLQTNANYFVWMDVWNRNTRAITNEDLTTATVEQPVYSVWIQKQGDPIRTPLFSGFHGNRNYIAYNPVNDEPKPFLDKVFFNIGSESLIGGAAGAYITTNMIALDDIYLSKPGFNSTIPRLLEVTSVAKGPGGVTLTWNSLGSLYQTNTYAVQRKLQLADPTWTTLTSGLPSGGGTTTYADNTVGDSATAYYRIVWP